MKKTIFNKSDTKYYSPVVVMLISVAISLSIYLIIIFITNIRGPGSWFGFVLAFSIPMGVSLPVSYRQRRYLREIQRQKKIIELANMRIHQSIDYASRIQLSMLPNEEIFLQNFKDYFIFFKPKDIVSGDFYWIKKNGDNVYFAAVDCTGHGVPGALISILAMSGLNEI